MNGSGLYDVGRIRTDDGDVVDVSVTGKGDVKLRLSVEEKTRGPLHQVADVELRLSKAVRLADLLCEAAEKRAGLAMCPVCGTSVMARDGGELPPHRDHRHGECAASGLTIAAAMVSAERPITARRERRR